MPTAPISPKVKEILKDSNEGRKLVKEIRERNSNKGGFKSKATKEQILNCICCNKEIKEIIEGIPSNKEWEGMWNDGIVDRIAAGYGSSLDGNMYIIAICDDCVKEKKLKYVGNYMFPTLKSGSSIG